MISWYIRSKLKARNIKMRTVSGVVQDASKRIIWVSLSTEQWDLEGAVAYSLIELVPGWKIPGLNNEDYNFSVRGLVNSCLVQEAHVNDCEDLLRGWKITASTSWRYAMYKLLVILWQWKPIMVDKFKWVRVVSVCKLQLSYHMGPPFNLMASGERFCWFKRAFISEDLTSGIRPITVGHDEFTAQHSADYPPMMYDLTNISPGLCFHRASVI